MSGLRNFRSDELNGSVIIHHVLLNPIVEIVLQGG